MEGKTPLAHESACSTVKVLPQSHITRDLVGIIRIAEPKHLGRQPYALEKLVT